MKYNIIEIIENQKEMLSEKRFNHILRVKDMAVQLAKIYNVDEEKIEVAALLHDCAKFFDDELAFNLISSEYKNEVVEPFKINQILHGFAGAEYVKKHFNILDEDILDAIRYHTIGKKGLSLFSKIIYLADAIEIGRNYENVDIIRTLAKNDINVAILLEIDTKIKHLIEKKSLIHPRTIEFRNELIKEYNANNRK